MLEAWDIRILFSSLGSIFGNFHKVDVLRHTISPRQRVVLSPIQPSVGESTPCLVLGYRIG
jgi:hypothetical protein